MQVTTISTLEEKEFKIIVDDVNDEVIAQYLLAHNIWEPLETKIVTKLLSAGKNVIDVGANIGYYTLLFSKIVGDKGQVISFEPESRNFSILNANALINDLGNVVLENQALSDSEGSSFLYLSGHNKGDHRLFYVPNRKRCHVNYISLDKYLSGFEGDIHFIKSDTQGHELKVLNGMKGVIKNNIDHLCCLMEFSPGLLEGAETGGVGEFLDFFDAYQSEIYWIDDAKGSCNLILHDKKDLQGVASDMLKNEEEDYSRDLLIFFSPAARSKYFNEMGLFPHRWFRGWGKLKYTLR